MKSAVAVLLAAVCSCGCGNRNSPGHPPPAQAKAEDLGQLPGLKATTNLELRAELARIVEENGTPEQLVRSRVADAENAAAELRALFPDAAVSSLLGNSTDLYPSTEFVFSPVALEKAVRFKRRYQSQREQARKALARPTCSFKIEYTAGFTADLTLVDVVRICGRLEAFEAADCLSKPDLDGAVVAVRQMLRLASCLAAEKHVTARLQAAFLRSEALAALQAVVKHPKIAIGHLERLASAVCEDLSAWPRDADAWFGDRAVGLHAYEIVRADQAAALLTEDEVFQFTAEGILEEFPRRARRTVDADELYYLRAMRKIIESCTRPYYARAEVFADLRNDLQQKRNSSDFPIVAGRLLLPNIEQGHAIQAQDRANCEGWAVALALVTGRDRPPYEVNPLTRKSYRVRREKGWVYVGNVSDAEIANQSTVAVPDFSQEK
ncbi:MAG: hypothetical protein HUU20_14400 [Pirellulales bacterium]|nr:hypothetical protein [Pirellulales bacterium]